MMHIYKEHKISKTARNYIHKIQLNFEKKKNLTKVGKIRLLKN